MHSLMPEGRFASHGDKKRNKQVGLIFYETVVVIMCSGLNIF